MDDLENKCTSIQDSELIYEQLIFIKGIAVNVHFVKYNAKLCAVGYFNGENADQTSEADIYVAIRKSRKQVQSTLVHEITHCLVQQLGSFIDIIEFVDSNIEVLCYMTQEAFLLSEQIDYTKLDCI